MLRDFMEIKSGKSKNYPPLIKDLVTELLKDDFVHFKILCANEVHHFNKEEDTIIEFEETYVKRQWTMGTCFILLIRIYSELNYTGM